MSFARSLGHYLNTFAALRGATVPETSYYAIVQTVLDAAGAQLRPAVKAIIHPKDTGAGIPDLGLFDDHQPLDQKPARGVIEAKPTNIDLLALAHSEQVARYTKHYGQVLITNYYQFGLVTLGEEGIPVLEERFNLADNEKTFWQMLTAPTGSGKSDVGEAFQAFLTRAMRRNAPLTTPQDVAWILASYAREAKARLESSGANLEALQRVRQQLEAALGVRFEDEAADEFFRSTLVQTLFYGVFSAWVLWHERHPMPGDKFDLWGDTRHLSVPVVQELFEQFSSGSHLPTSVEQVLEWTVNALNRVDRTAFFDRFERSDAVQYFYEPFLEAFDPDLRRQLGVWYTPREVVQYMVARVDAALRDELNIRDGLADPNVYVLDPCCGTGAFLVEVLHTIAQRLVEQEGTVLAAQAVQTAMRERVFGFEILPAPFVVAHLQLGILLNQLHAPLQPGQRAGVFLTNALTGWQEKTQKPLDFPELRREREAAEDVKQQRPILVILGNPPYSGFAGVAMDEERDLTNAYRTTKRAPAPQGQGLNDLYVRFYRMAERRIAEHTGRGIVCFISNYSWLDGLSHTGMRERYLEAFDTITIDCLNGDKFKNGKLTPDGKPDPSIFSTEFNREGIQIGTAIALLVRKPSHSSTNGLLFRHLWGTGKRAQLKIETDNLNAIEYETIRPALEIGLPFTPHTVSADYLSWPLLPELFPIFYPGVSTSRDVDLVDIDKPDLEMRMQAYFNTDLNDDEVRKATPHLMDSTKRFDAPKTRQYLLKRGINSGYFVRFCYQPFDVRWLYWHPETKLIDEKREELFQHIQRGNILLACRQKAERENEGSPAYVTSHLPDRHMTRPGSICFPLYLYATPGQQATLFDVPQVGRKPNLSENATAYLERAGADETALFYHALAVLHSPAYRTENAGALRQDWPRVPLPTAKDALLESAQLGQRVAALLDAETPVEGVTEGRPCAEIAGIAELATTGGAPDFRVTVGWGHFGQGGAVMPGRGRVTPHDDGSRDIYLNDNTYWKNVPVNVWEYTLGGYQVLKKWLSYRETVVLGRPLKPDEAREFMHIARRITALLALDDTLDANYRTVTKQD